MNNIQHFLQRKQETEEKPNEQMEKIMQSVREIAVKAENVKNFTKVTSQACYGEEKDETTLIGCIHFMADLNENLSDELWNLLDDL